MEATLESGRQIRSLVIFHRNPMMSCDGRMEREVGSSDIVEYHYGSLGDFKEKMLTLL